MTAYDPIADVAPISLSQYDTAMEWLAIVTPPAIWLHAMWGPYLKTYRDGLSLTLSFLAGLIAFAALKLHYLPLLICSGVTLGAMLVAMLWPPVAVAARQRRPSKRKVR
jgi:hypothetical protein